jgi:putative transposase
MRQTNPFLAPHPLYIEFGRDDKERQIAYRELLRTHLEREAIDDIRLALNQNQPLGDTHFRAKIEPVTGQSCAADRVYTATNPRSMMQGKANCLYDSECRK